MRLVSINGRFRQTAYSVITADDVCKASQHPFDFLKIKINLLLKFHYYFYFFYYF